MKYVLLSLLALSSLAQAANHTVEMLSWKDGQSMIFSPAVLTVDVGDTVTFVPTQPGHQVTSISIPKDSPEFSSPLSQQFTLNIDKEGVYFYTCSPHRAMNMSGLIQAGKAVNLEAVTKAVAQEEQSAMMNQGRITEYLEELKNMSK